MKKALIVVTSNNELGSTGELTGYYLPEVTHIFYPLKEAGFEVEFASILGGQAPMDPGSYDLDDEFNRRFVNDQKEYSKVLSTIKIGNVDPNLYSIIYFAGGHGTMWDFHNSDELNSVASKIYEAGGIVSAVCHGPSALVNIKLSNGQFLVNGKKVNSFTNAEEDAVELSSVVPFLLESKLKERGALFVSGDKWENFVVADKRLITGQNPQSALSLGHKIVEVAKENNLI